MTEQEATELIATKLMGWRKSRVAPIRPIWDYWVDEEGNALFSTGHLSDEFEIFDPFHDSNHARMVKNKLSQQGILKSGLCENYFEKLYYRVMGDGWQEGITAKSAFKLHMASNADCMWAVVDVLKEMEK